MRRDVQERVERMSEPVSQHGVARAVPADVANDQVRGRQDRRDETDEDGQGDERDDDHDDEDQERRADEEAEEDQGPDLDRTERQRSREADLGGDLLGFVGVVGYGSVVGMAKFSLGGAGLAS